MVAADHLVDMGPKAGTFGGEVVFSGSHKELGKLPKEHESLTAAYLSKRKEIVVPLERRILNDKLTILGARANNLKGFKVSIPLRGLVAVTGVSGSGKSTLITDILVPALKAKLESLSPFTKGFTGLEGDINTISSLEFINQNPIGKSSRSCPVTYVKAFDEIRTLLSNTSHAKAKGLGFG